MMMLGVGASAGTQLSSSVAGAWAHLLDSDVSDMGIDMALDRDAVYYLSTAGSSVAKAPSLAVYFDNTQVATGAVYNGNGTNNNLNLVKLDHDGNFQWCLYSSEGDLQSNNGNIALLPDGSLIVTAVIRHTDGRGTHPFTIVDAAGKATSLSWTLVSDDDSRFYQGLMMRVDADGNLLWTKMLNVSNAPQPGYDKPTTSAFYLSGLTTDASGNFIVAGRYCNPLTIKCADGSTLTLTPHNTADWNGDAQATRGDIFIARFNPDGLLLDYRVTEGVATVETSPVFARCGDDLLLNFIAAGNGDMKLAGAEFSLRSDNHALITMRLDGDLKAKWINVLQADSINAKKPFFQANTLNVAGDNLWLTGMGDFVINDVASTTSNNSREGFVFKFDLDNGSLLAATTSRKAFPSTNAITGYMGAFESAEQDDNRVFLYGYCWNGSAVTLSALDKTTLAADEMITLIAGGSMPTSQVMAAVGNRLFTVSRGRDNGMEAQRFSLLNSDIALASRDWAACYACFELGFNVLEPDDTPATPGDLNGDGSVNAGDVSSLYEAILSGDSDSTFDLNGDGSVNAGDVSALYSIILTQ